MDGESCDSLLRNQLWRVRVHVRLALADYFLVLPSGLFQTNAKDIRALRSQREAQQAMDAGGDVAPILAGLCDQLIRSTNGATTITGMWQDELLPLAMLARISEAVPAASVAVAEPVGASLTAVRL